MKLFIPFFFLIIFSMIAYGQEVGFFHTIECSPNKPETGHEISIKFSKQIPYLKIFEFEEDKKGKKTSSDMFPAKILESHVFLSQKYCQFHVISRRPSVDFFHFVMNVEHLKSKDTHSYSGPAHFNFLIDDVSPTAKEHKLLNCKINGLKIPGYYFHSCKKKKTKPLKTPLPNLPYYQDLQNPQNINPNNDQGGRSGAQ